MSVFKDIKDHVTTRQVVEYYGLKVGRNGMASCPFHDDKHPSMKVDSGYYCFGCGAHGDAIGYVAQLYGLSQFDAACKIIGDFSLPIVIHPSDDREQKKAGMKWRKEKEECDRIIHIRERFRKWRDTEIAVLHRAREGIRRIKDSFCNADPDEVFASKEYEAAVMIEPLIEYWLDVLCLGAEEDQIELFTKGRKEVEKYVERVTGVVERCMGGSRTDIGCGMQQRGRYPA